MPEHACASLDVKIERLVLHDFLRSESRYSDLPTDLAGMRAETILALADFFYSAGDSKNKEMAHSIWSALTSRGASFTGLNQKYISAAREKINRDVVAEDVKPEFDWLEYVVTVPQKSINYIPAEINAEFKDKFFHQIHLVTVRSENSKKSQEEVIEIAVHDHLGGAGKYSDFSTITAQALASEMLALANNLILSKDDKLTAMAIYMALVSFSNPLTYKNPLNIQLAMMAQSSLDKSLFKSSTESNLLTCINAVLLSHLYKVSAATATFLKLERHTEISPENYEENIKRLLELAYRLNLSKYAENKELAYQIWQSLSENPTFEQDSVNLLIAQAKRLISENPLDNTFFNKAMDYLNGTEIVKQNKKQAQIIFDQIISNTYLNFYIKSSPECVEKAQFQLALMKAKSGNSDAAMTCSTGYSLGIGIPVDYVKANFYLHKAADTGHGDAAFKLAKTYVAILADNPITYQGFPVVHKQEAYNRANNYFKVAVGKKIPGAAKEYAEFKENFSKQYGGFFNSFFGS